MNPRWSFPHTDFRDLHLKPLGHSSRYFIYFIKCLFLPSKLTAAGERIYFPPIYPFTPLAHKTELINQRYCITNKECKEENQS